MYIVLDFGRVSRQCNMDIFFLFNIFIQFAFRLNVSLFCEIKIVGIRNDFFFFLTGQYKHDTIEYEVIHVKRKVSVFF